MDQPKKKSMPKPLPNAVKYTGIAFQLLATMIIFSGIGYYIDNTFFFDKIFTVIFSLLGIGIGLYNVIRAVL